MTGPAATAVDVDIVIQDVATFRIDPHALRRPPRRLALVVSPGNHGRLLARGHETAFDAVVVQEDFGADALVTAVRSLLTRLRADHRADVRLLCHDEYSLGAVAEARERLELAGATVEETAPFIDKLVMKERLTGSGVSLPRYRRWDHAAWLAHPRRYVTLLARDLGWPMFVKPLNESGSVGTRRLNDSAAVEAWAREHGSSGDFEVDEFLDGTLYHVDSLVSDGEILLAQPNGYLFPCYDYLDGKVCSTFTLPDTDPVHDRLLQFNERVLRALSVKPSNTVTHLEVFERVTGDLVFLEIAARAPAALVPYVYEKYRGFNIELAHFQLQMGERPDVGQPRGPYAGFVYFPRHRGIVQALHPPVLRSEHQLTWLVGAGERLEDPADIREAAATLLLWNRDYSALRADLDELSHHAVVTFGSLAA
jgi:hypothetical protein